MEFPVPLTAETDPINILLRPFDPIPTEVRRGEEDVFWKMVNGDLEISIKAHEELARRDAAEKARLEAIEAQKALMMGAYNEAKNTKLIGNADGEVVYESLVRPTKAVAKGEFPLMKLSSASAIAPVSRPIVEAGPPPKVAHVPPKPAPNEPEAPPAAIEHTTDAFTKGLMQNSNLHIHRTRHDPVNLYWSMPGFK